MWVCWPTDAPVSPSPVLVVLSLRPVWDAQYAIPLLGMLLGNATSAVSVGLSTALDDLATSECRDGCVETVR